MYTLYYSPGTASMCVHHALIETGAEYRLIRVDLEAGGQRDPAYLKLNPNGVVPTLLIDDVPFTESAALLMTIATRHPQAGLAPAESFTGPHRVVSVDRLLGQHVAARVPLVVLSGRRQRRP